MQQVTSEYQVIGSKPGILTPSSMCDITETLTWQGLLHP